MRAPRYTQDQTTRHSKFRTTSANELLPKLLGVAQGREEVYLASNRTLRNRLGAVGALARTDVPLALGGLRGGAVGVWSEWGRVGSEWGAARVCCGEGWRDLITWVSLK